MTLSISLILNEINSRSKKTERRSNSVDLKEEKKHSLDSFLSTLELNEKPMESEDSFWNKYQWKTTKDEEVAKLSTEFFSESKESPSRIEKKLTRSEKGRSKSFDRVLSSSQLPVLAKPLKILIMYVQVIGEFEIDPSIVDKKKLKLLRRFIGYFSGAQGGGGSFIKSKGFFSL